MKCAPRLLHAADASSEVASGQSHTLLSEGPENFSASHQGLREANIVLSPTASMAGPESPQAHLSYH